ncbi:MAG: GGDEF domain-containing protein [Gorillibacterium sp.]|nr:GGDEF domain-containing protein [Gorillibacterium sp.]
MLNNYQGNEFVSSWNHKIRRLYWVLYLVLMVSSLAALPNVFRENPEMLRSFIRNHILIQNSFILALLILAEWINRLRSKLQDYILLIIGSCYASIVVGSIPIPVYGVQLVMILPILVSIFYFNYGKVIFSCAISLMSYLWTLAVISYDGVVYNQKSLGFTLILFCSFTALGIVNRGLRMIKDEKRALLNEAKHRLQEHIMNETCHKDALTGLNNHKSFQENIRLALNDTYKRPLHLAMIDLDNFKSINDTFGHWAGDTVLHRIGALLLEFSEERILTSRYGGEEFAIIFTGLQTIEVFERLEKLRADVEQIDLSELSGSKISISVGCRQLMDNEDCNSLFMRADEALYQAKHGGKNRVV